MKKKVLAVILGVVLSVTLLLSTVYASTTTTSTRPYPVMAPAQEVGTYNSQYGVKIYPFEIQTLTNPADDLYYHDFTKGISVDQMVIPASPMYNDANGFPVLPIKGVNYYHPVATAQHAIYYMEAYQQLGNPAYLEEAKKLANHLANLSIHPVDHSLNFAYKFPYSVQQVEPITPYWYSSMAEGQALSVFTRLYKITHEQRYLDYANRTMQTLVKMQTALPAPKPWVTMKDGHQYLWFEEYPTETKTPIHVFNGFMFTIYGLYDYYELTHNAKAKALLQASLSTVLAYGDRYRLPGDYSYYSLKSNLAAPAKYHHIHIVQLGEMYKITGDLRFQEMSDRFYADTPPTTTTSALSPHINNGLTPDEIQLIANQ